jgi:hypothetical protein
VTVAIAGPPESGSTSQHVPASMARWTLCILIELRSVKIGHLRRFGNCAGGVRRQVGVGGVSEKRRGRGEGAVYYEAGRRRWVGVLDLGRDGNRRRVRRKVVGASEKAARDALRKLREEIENGARARNGGPDGGSVPARLAGWSARCRNS